MSQIDAVELAVIRSALVNAAEEMSVTVWRTSRSSVVREILDYSTCVFDADGFSVAQAARMPVHLNSMASCLRDLVEKHIPLEEWRPGDVIMTNDPYSGGQHLPDVQTFAPVFVDGRRVAIAGILVHHLDVGGGAPGSYDPNATEIFHEGIQIPPVRVVNAGVTNDDLIKVFLRNSREPENVGGDFASQLAALRVGGRSLERVARRYGPDRLADACDAIQDQSEVAMRNIIAAVPDGEYRYTDYVDDDGNGSDPLTIASTLRVHGDTLTVDLTGSSAQAAGPVNCTLNMASSAVICAVLMSIGNEVAANAGCYRPVSIIAPEGTVVNARSPAPVANRMAVGHRVVNTVMGSFAMAMPQKVPAAYYGVSYAYALQTIGEDGERNVYFDLECGGWGAHPSADGASGFSCGFHNVSNSPVEMLEQDYPITFQKYALLPDSGGAGKYRGGLGLVREFRLDAPQGRFAANLDRFKFPPYGLAGGEPGKTGRLWLRRAGQSHEESLASKVRAVTLYKGDTIRLETSGGGGHGDALTRHHEAVTADIRDGYITREQARNAYAYKDSEPK
jgi:N-methylhydantoinase B